MGRKKKGRMGPYIPKPAYKSVSVDRSIELAKERNAHLSKPTQLKAFEDFLQPCHITNLPRADDGYELESSWRIKNTPKKWVLNNPGKTVIFFHGTKTHSVASIILRGLHPSSRGAFGPGIYIAPTISKAMSFTGWDEYKYVLMGTAALGKMFDVVDQRRSVPTDYDSMWVRAGNRNDILLNYDEIIISDPKRVLVTHLLVYKFIKKER